MRLLIITQKVDINDDVLGFFHNWLNKLAPKAELFVVANYVGQYDLPSNVRVFSLGKERGTGKLMKFLKYQKFLIKFLPKCDGIFFHMCPEYVIAAGLWPKIFRKKTLLWYTHKAVNWKIKLAEKLVNKVFTASKESFRLPSKKVEITGHGIDINKFKSRISSLKSDGKFKIITAGRVASIKNLGVLMDVAEILRNKNFSFDIKIAGTPKLENDKKYLEGLKQSIKEIGLEKEIIFLGPISYKDIDGFYKNADLFVNFSDTGSIDKAVLEAMACGINVLTSNEAFTDILGGEIFIEKNPEKIARKIIEIADNNSIRSDSLAEYTYKNHNLDNLIGKIVNFYG